MQKYIFLGREFFVGISEFTNEDGARAVAMSFPEYPVTPIKVKSKVLFLLIKNLYNLAS